MRVARLSALVRSTRSDVRRAQASHVEATPLSKHLENFVPTAVFCTMALAISGGVAYIYGQYVSLKWENENKQRSAARTAGVV
jgi:hypothetical protein